MAAGPTDGGGDLAKVIYARYVGQKRLSSGRGESLIPLPNYLAELATKA